MDVAPDRLQKSVRVVTAAAVGCSKSLLERLDDGSLGHILGYLNGLFRFVAGVDRRFRLLYPHDSKTTYESVVQSMATAAMWLEERNEISGDDSACFAVAIRKGDLHMVEWLWSEAQFQYGFDFSNQHGMLVAATCGNLTVLKWLAAQDPSFPFCSRLSRAAARNGQIEVVAWLRLQDDDTKKWDRPACRAATASGQLEVVQWFGSLDPPCQWPTR